MRLALLVGTDGRVHRIVPGGVNNDPWLLRAAVNAASHWAFRPAFDANGKPAACWVIVPIGFSLK